MADTTRDELLAEAALILEQEGWLLARWLHENPHSSRLKQFATRYKEWQDKVTEYRKEHPEDWTEPPDNS